tara:strand:+ start:1952 stop:2830 length:879 start_codon:yes stop_codon:yes gene_type:complete
MKKIILFLSFVNMFNVVYSQAAYVQPVPTNVNMTARINVDISKPDCECPNLQDANFDDPLYLWSWLPSEPIVGNGSWDSSNEELRMIQDNSNPNIWYIDVIITDFYGVSVNTAYSNGLSYLVKKKNGLDGGNNDLENKSRDFNITLIPPPCEDRLCPYPQALQQDDYFTIIYNISKELNINFNPDSLSINNEGILMDGDISIHLRINTNLGNTYENSPQNQMFNISESNFLPLYNIESRYFSYTFIPEEIYDLEPSEYISEIEVTFIKNIDPTGLTPGIWRTQMHAFPVGCN